MIDKLYHVTSAIYRMLRQRRIDQQTATELLTARAKMSARNAKATAELWMPSLKRRWNLEDLDLNEWGDPL